MRLLIFFSLFISSLSGFSQLKKNAAKHFDAGNFETALDEYLQLHENHPEVQLYSYRLAVCYLNTNIDKKAAVPLLQEVVKDSLADPNAWYLLGRAYHFSEKYDEAINTYVKFLTLQAGNEANRKNAGKQIEYCQNAKELIKFPIKVKFENLGPNINTAAPEFYPFLPVNESFIIFNSRRNDGSDIKKNGNFYSNIYFARREDGEFFKATKLSTINRIDEDNYVVGLSNSGDVALVVSESEIGYDDLKFVLRQNGTFSMVQELDENINTKYTEIAASINDDSTAIYFASDMPGGFGGIDLYVSRRLPNGKWALPQNLGPGVNTIYDEDFPSISPDGKTLFFSSKGHTSMGGYDIFRAEFNEEKKAFMQVRNMGYPINSVYDDMNFRLSEDGRYGYLSTFREGGFGDLDIYRVIFEDIEPEYTVVKGVLRGDDTTKVPEAAFITVTNTETGELFGEYQPNGVSGRYVMILPPGKYHLFVEAIGHQSWETDLDIKLLDALRREEMLDISLKAE